ncbi:DUF916 domain-containing protein [Leifsonia kafniensis]|uniref:DUF916 domain-containing protein n=1 Tax=Leifsonia kafniensis TaxID=475957 RepID=A0ABP7KWK4_9MICO
MNARPAHRMRAAVALLHAGLLALVVAGGLASVSPALAAEGAGDVTWGVRTASNENGADRQNFSYTIDPGAQLSDALVISNHDTEPLELDVYAADGFTTTSGQLDLVTPDTASIAVGAWTTVSSGHLQIAAGETVEVPFEVTVPADATPGDYAGGILTSLLQPGQEQGINVDRRLGIRMHVRVLGDLAPSLAIEKMHIDYAGSANPFGTGDATVTYTVHNTGNVRIAAAQTLKLAGPFGLLSRNLEDVAAVPEILPGESWTVSVPVAGVFPAFWLSATATLAPEFAVVAGATPGIDPVSVTMGSWVIPWAPLALLVLVAAVVVAVVLLGKRRHRVHKQREDARVRQAVEEALLEKETSAVAVF